MVNCGSGTTFAGLRHEKQKWGTVELVELLETYKGLKLRDTTTASVGSVGHQGLQRGAGWSSLAFSDLAV